MRCQESQALAVASTQIAFDTLFDTLARIGRGRFVSFWHTSNVDPAVPYLSGNCN